MKHEPELLPGSKDHLWWKYFKVILKESNDAISPRVPCRGWECLRHRTDLDYSDFAIPGKGTQKRTRGLEATVDLTGGWTHDSFIHWSKKYLSAYGGEHILLAWALPWGRKQPQEGGWQESVEGTVKEWEGTQFSLRQG